LYNFGITAHENAITPSIFSSLSTLPQASRTVIEINVTATTTTKKEMQPHPLFKWGLTLKSFHRKTQQLL
jgi:hypothetical protein